MNKNDYLLIRVTVEIQIRHDLPRHLTADAATKTHHLTGQQPPHQSNWMTRLNINRHHLVSVCCISTHLLLSKFFPPCECQQYSVSSLRPCDKIAHLNWFKQNLQKIMPSNLAITGKILSDNFKNWLASYWLSNFGTKITICNVVSKKNVNSMTMNTSVDFSCNFTHWSTCTGLSQSRTSSWTDSPVLTLRFVRLPCLLSTEPWPQFSVCNSSQTNSGFVRIFFSEFSCPINFCLP